MSHTAAELIRVMATTTDEGVVREYGLRRLSAVPEMPLFHVGDRDDWVIDIAGAGTDHITVAITGHVRPLPITGAFVRALGAEDETGLVLHCEASESVQADWVSGSYGSWMQMWS